MSWDIRKCDKNLLSEEMDAQIVVRDDVATLSFGAGFECDRGAAAMLQTLLFRDQQGVRSGAPLTWNQGGGYLLGEHLFLHVDDLLTAVDILCAENCLVEARTIPEDRNQFQQAEQPDMLTGVAPWEHDLTTVLQRKACGQILVPRNEAAGVIVAITKMYPTQNILVVARNNAVCRAIARELNQRMDRRVSLGSTVHGEDAPLVHIQSISGLDRSSHDWPILIFADAESARSDTGMRQAVSMPDSLIYAVVSTDLKLDQEVLLRLRVTCGPELYRLTDAPFTGTAVTVLLVRAKRKRRGSPSNPLCRKRTHLWHNDPRNQQVAELAKAFAAADFETLGQLGVPVEALQQQLQDLGRQPRVAIIVESPNHARRLRQMLPEWQIAAGARLADKDLPMLPQECDRTILTLTRALAAGVLADVVIRAEGTEQAWTWDLGPHYGLTRNSMIVVDLFDTFDAQASYAARRRRIDYAAQSWKIIESITSRAAETAAR